MYEEYVEVRSFDSEKPGGSPKWKVSPQELKRQVRASNGLDKLDYST